MRRGTADDVGDLFSLADQASVIVVFRSSVDSCPPSGTHYVNDVLLTGMLEAIRWEDSHAAVHGFADHNDECVDGRLQALRNSVGIVDDHRVKVNAPPRSRHIVGHGGHVAQTVGAQWITACQHRSDGSRCRRSPGRTFLFPALVAAPIPQPDCAEADPRAGVRAVALNLQTQNNTACMSTMVGDASSAQHAFHQPALRQP